MKLIGAQPKHSAGTAQGKGTGLHFVTLATFQYRDRSSAMKYADFYNPMITCLSHSAGQGEVGRGPERTCPPGGDERQLDDERHDGLPDQRSPGGGGK